MRLHSLSRKKMRMDTFLDRLNFLIDRFADGKWGKLAKITGIKEPTFQGYMSKGRIPRYEQLLCFRESLGVSANWLLFGEGEPFVKKESDMPKNNVVPLDRTPNHQHHRLINNFDNQPLAFEVNRALLHLEQNSPDDFRQVAGYVMGRSDAVKKPDTQKKVKNGQDQ